MANPQDFDKLNILKRRSLPYEEYFGVMLLSKKQKKDREDMSFILEDILMLMFEVMQTGIEMNALDETAIKQEFTYQLYDAVEGKNFFVDESQQYRYITNLVDETYRATIENYTLHPYDYDYTGEKPYWLSGDRATFIAENEANTLYNGSDYMDAIKSGKQWKIWSDYGDDNVRPTHIEANGLKIPIDDYFEVGNAQMLYPKDTTSEFSTAASFPEEVINCRCSVIYV